MYSIAIKSYSAHAVFVSNLFTICGDKGKDREVFCHKTENEMVKPTHTPGGGFAVVVGGLLGRHDVPPHGPTLQQVCPR